jgi:hypothetical protein
MGITTVFHIFAPRRRGGAAEIGFLGAERATIPAFGPSLDSGFRGFAVATAGRNLAAPRSHSSATRSGSAGNRSSGLSTIASAPRRSWSASEGRHRPGVTGRECMPHPFLPSSNHRHAGTALTVTPSFSKRCSWPMVMMRFSSHRRHRGPESGAWLAARLRFVTIRGAGVGRLTHGISMG